MGALGDSALSSNDKKPLLSNNPTLLFFNSYFSKHINNTFDKFKDYKNIKEIIRAACNVFFNVFWLEFSSSLNIFESLLMAEKSIVRYNKFIVLSYKSDLVENYAYRPSVIDAVIFSYKKTLDCIKVGDISYESQTKDIIKCSYFFKEISILLYTNQLDPTNRINVIEQLYKNCYSFESAEGIQWFDTLVSTHNL